MPGRRDTVHRHSGKRPRGEHRLSVNLGIAKGTSATTFSPGSDLTAWQIALFLLRTYEEAGHSREAPETELTQALDCLLGLRVIPSAAEGGDDEAVDRAQMAVYVIGLWHNLKGLGLPPSPPGKGAPQVVGNRGSAHEPRTAFSDPDADPGLWTPEGTRAGAVTVHVFYCAKDGKYTRDDLAAAVRLLNNEVAPRWKAESSDAIELTLVAGSTVSPALAWDEPVDAHEALDACEREARGADMDDIWVYPNFPDSFLLEVLFLLDIEFDTSIGGLGGRGFTVTEGGKLLYRAGGTAMVQSPGSLGGYHLWAVSHELGYSTLDLPATVTAVAGEAQVTVTWTAPTFTAGAPVTGYRVELHKGAVVQEYEGGYLTEYKLETVHETGPDARTHTFDVAVGDTFPYDEYFVDVHAISGAGTSEDNSSDYVRPTPASSVQVSDLGPRGFTLTWDPVPDAVNYALSGFGQFVDVVEHGDDGRRTAAARGGSQTRIQPRWVSGTSNRTPRTPSLSKHAETGGATASPTPGSR